MMYHAIHLNNNLVVRPVVAGITEIEWLHGCRCFEIFASEFQLKTRLKDRDDMNLLTTEEWSQFISSLDDPGNVPNNNFISTYVKRDKWDSNRPIY
jgi:hypothetical protein